VANVRAKLGHCLARARRFEEAERELLAVATLWRSSRDVDPLWRDRVAGQLAEMYDAWGKPDKAAAWRAAPPGDSARAAAAGTSP
jgi:hypothetical protein